MIGAAVGAVLLCLIQVYQVHSYVAAVVEFSPTGVDGPVVPPLTVANNLYRYEEFVQEAKKSFADIIVFPEYGLTTTFPSNNRTMALEFGQVVPQKSDNGNPCEDDNQSIEYETVRRLSCMARDNRIYLVANLIERDDKQGAGTMLYNTNVAFDSSGIVVSRYRKYNLFGEFALNTTTESDISIFEAFGARFGMVTCFDLMFQHPAVTLVRKYGITDLIFPTAWIHELPFLTGPQAQASFAYGNHVNILASEYNVPEEGHSGSAIILGRNPNGEYIATITQEITSMLLVATVPTDTNGPSNNKQENGIIKGQGKSKGLRMNKNLLFTEDKLEDYTAVPLPKNSLDSSIEACNNNFCCLLTFSINKMDIFNFHYQLMVFDGVRTHMEGRYETEMQVCALVACSDDTKAGCSKPPSDSSYSSVTEFNKISIQATFKSNVTLPNTLNSQTLLPFQLSDYNFNVNQQNFFTVIERAEPIINIHTFGIYSHDYLL
ncbi:Hypothetical predicted protein [Cloeon dipterum]|uniref:CN hydrolase domain-containing protein n=1 Tax=Cloeon dipterum TaxID=197152 RepID=A0A8S1BUS1_9INSE|nr:Hypothetical predicted protein [Cloeon dipterum]